MRPPSPPKWWLVSDTGKFNDRSFNQSSWAGMQAAQTDNPKLKISYVPSNSGNDYTPNLNAEVAKKCDAIISGMNDTPDRRKSVAFVDYLNVGQSLIGKKGNPLKIKTILDVCGRVAGAQVATTNLETLQKFDKQCKAKGKKGIKIISFKEDPLGVIALKTGHLDVYESDSPPAVWYTTKDKSLQIVGKPIQPRLAAGIPGK